jgi:hypothetical protein
MIWEAVMPGPRIVRVERHEAAGGRCIRVWSDTANDSSGNRRFFEDRAVEDWEFLLWANQPIYGLRAEGSDDLALFYACRESHKYVSRTHDLAFGSLGIKANILFNFNEDTLYIQGDWCGLTEDRLRVQRLALSDAFTGVIETHQNITLYLLDTFEYFGNIQECFLVSDYFVKDSWDLVWAETEIDTPNCPSWTYSLSRSTYRCISDGEVSSSSMAASTISSASSKLTLRTCAPVWFTGGFHHTWRYRA